jgi:hypothetical protein
MRLFLCAWTIDRLNAAFHGRPVLMHERDFDLGMKQCIARYKPAFQVMLRVVDLLDKVISLYRPPKRSLRGAARRYIPSLRTTP